MKNLTFIFILLLLLSCVNHRSNNTQDPYGKVDSIAFASIKDSEEYLDFSAFIVNYPESEYFEEALEKYKQYIANKWYSNEIYQINEEQIDRNRLHNDA